MDKKNEKLEAIRGETPFKIKEQVDAWFDAIDRAYELGCRDTEQKLNLHSVSGKQQIQWQAIESYVNRFSTSNEPFKQLLLKQAREWFEGEFVACASGAVDTVAAGGHEFTCRVCGEHEKEWSRKNDDWYCKTCGHICNPN